MKKIILFIILFAFTGFAQNYIIRQDSLRASEAATKLHLKNAIKDSLDANARGWQTAAQVGQRILDSLNANSRSWQTSTQVSQRILDSLNANTRGWRTQAQAKADAIDTISALPLSSNPTADNYVFGETGTGLRKFVLDDLPLSSNMNQALSNLNNAVAASYVSVGDYQNIVNLLNSLEQTVDSLGQRIAILESNIPVNYLPLTPTNFEIHGTGTTTIAGSFTSPSSPFDSVIIELRVYSLNNDQSYSIVSRIDSGITTFNLNGLDSNTIYQGRCYALKYSGSIANTSNYSNTDTALTFTGSPANVPGLKNPLFAADYEEGNMSDVTSIVTNGSSIVSASATAKYNNNYGMLMNFDGVNRTVYAEQTHLSTDTVWGSFWIKVPKITTADTLGGFKQWYVLQLGNESNYRLRLGYQTGSSTVNGGKIDAYALTFNDGTDNSTKVYNTIPPDTNWNLIQYLWIQNTTTGGAKIWLNGNLIFNYLNRNTGADGITYSRLGSPSNSLTALGTDELDAYYDSWAESSSDSVGNWESTITTSPVIGQWFVNANVTTSGNGSSYATAWKTFADINWASMKSGDTLIIAEGTYNEILEPAKHNITIIRSPHAGYNGTVYIDGGNVRSYGINLASDSSITIDGLDSSKFIIRNFTNNGVRVRGASHNFTLKNVSIHTNSNGNGANIFVQYDGVNAYQMRNIKFYKVRVITHTAGSFSGQNDGAQIDGVDSLVVDNCSFNVKHNNNLQHCDAIQAYRSKNVYIKNSIFSNEGTSTSNKQGIYLEDVTGNVYVVNNYVYINQNATGSALSIENWNGLTNKNIRVINNTIVTLPTGSPQNLIRLGNETDLSNPGNAIIRNNIFVGSGAIWYDDRYFLNAIDCDYNIYYKYGSAVTIWDATSNSGGATRTWSYWTGTLGWDTHSYTTNPNLINNGYVLTTPSDAIDKGYNNSAYTPIDILGTTRPQGSAWDIGAFEYVP